MSGAAPAFRGAFTPQVNPMHRQQYGFLPPLRRPASAAIQAPVSPIAAASSGISLQASMNNASNMPRINPQPRLAPIVLRPRAPASAVGVSNPLLPIFQARTPPNSPRVQRSSNVTSINPILSAVSLPASMPAAPSGNNNDDELAEAIRLSLEQPPLAQPLPDDNRTLEILRGVLGRFEIREDFLQHLLQLEGYEISLILDDSGSMGSSSDAPQPPGFKGFAAGNPYGTRWTRLEEMKYISKILISVATIFDRNGVDLYFLNSGTHNNVTNVEQFDSIMLKSGGTPLVENFLQASGKVLENNKKHLIFIITDGEPNEGVTAFKNALMAKSENVYVSILACTGDDSVVGYLNDIDETVPNVDCVDDYTSERNEVLFVQGEHFPFSYGDYIIKGLLGAVDPAFDLLDERNLLDKSYVLKYPDYSNAEKGKNYIIMTKNVERMSPNERRKYMVGNIITLKKRSNKLRGAYVQDTVQITAVSGNRIEINQALTHNYKRGVLATMATPFTRVARLFKGGSKTKRTRNKKTRRNRRTTKNK
jgi:hypothetical protein